MNSPSGAVITGNGCLIPHTTSSGKDAAFDISLMRPGDFFDPTSKWQFVKGKYDKGAIPISWLFFKGDMSLGPTPTHPFEGPWQKVNKVTFSVGLLSANSSRVHQVMGSTDVNDFWKTLLHRQWNSQHKLSVNLFTNRSCPIYEFGNAVYWWIPANDLDRKETYQLQLNASDTEGIFLSHEFRLDQLGLLDGIKSGTPKNIGGGFTMAILILLGMGGLYYWWQRQQKYRPWFLRRG